MPVCLTITHTRPNTGVEFYFCSEEFQNYQFTAYGPNERPPRFMNKPPCSAGPGWYEDLWLSNNDLTITNKIYFVDRAAYTRFSEDSQVIALLNTPWDAYIEANNITRTLEVEEIDSIPDIPSEYLGQG